MNQAFAGLMSHSTARACLVDLTPPVWDTTVGIQGLVPQVNGALLASWNSATDADSPPVRYKIYIQPASESSITLFAPGNHVNSVHHLESYIYTDRDDNALEKGVSYRVGIQAIDAVGNQDSNMISLTATSTGVLTDDLATIAASLAATEALLASDHTNFAADHADFQQDHTNFAADHADLHSDITDLEAAISDIQDAATSLENSAAVIASGSNSSIKTALSSKTNSATISQREAVRGELVARDEKGEL